MLSKEILKKIAAIEIHTKRIMNTTLIGDTRSAQKGSGFEFNQLRDYQMGDDVRFIDWRASARADKLLVREYIEERSRTVMILLDISHSTDFTSGANPIKEITQQVAAVLAFIAGYSKDRVGLMLYTNEVECVVPPALGHAHVHAILGEIFGHAPKASGTCGAAALERLMRMKNRNAAIYLISDCVDDSLEKVLKTASRVYEIVIIRCLDINERHIPEAGFLTTADLETHEQVVLDTRALRREGLHSYLEKNLGEQLMLYKKYGIDYLDLYNNETFIGEVVRFFRRRMAY